MNKNRYVKFVAPVLFLLLFPYSLHSCVAGPQDAPGHSRQNLPQGPCNVDGKDQRGNPCVTDAEREETVWLSMGHFEVAPSGWGDIEMISNMYYSFQSYDGLSGGCGPESIYFYKNSLIPLLLGLLGSIIILYALLSRLAKRRRGIS